MGVSYACERENGEVKHYLVFRNILEIHFEGIDYMVLAKLAQSDQRSRT